MIRNQLLWLYCQIRFVQYAFQFLTNSLLPDHDAHVFNPPLWSLDSNSTYLDLTIDKLFSGLRRWDAVHFLHIARFGYIYESSLAFFPTYPILFIRPLSYLFQTILIESNAYLFSAILINFLLGYLNTCLLYELGLKFHLKVNHALWTSVLYMINPATVFFLAPYSESLFLTSQLLGHNYLKSDRIFFSSLCFAFGSTIRSNGLVSFGFILYYYLNKSYQKRTFIFPLHYFILCLSSFLLAQFYLYKEYCFEKTNIHPDLKFYGVNENLPMPLTNFSTPWCLQTLPISYQYIQKTHWNVGFFNYWTWKQIPNFCLALPVFILIGQFIRNWFHFNRKELWKQKYKFLFHHQSTKSSKDLWFNDKDFLPHIIYTLFLCLFACIFMHIQVSTRFLYSSGPFLYMISADRIKQYNIQNGKLKKILYLFKKETWLFYYYFIYVCFGICLFSNFLPWT